MTGHQNTPPQNDARSPLGKASGAVLRGSSALAESGRKIRVMIVITRLTIGGDTNVVLDIASYLHQHPNYEVRLALGPVFAPEIDLTHLAYDRGIPTLLIRHLVNHIDPMTNIKAVMELRAHIIREKIDIVHTHSSVAGVVGRLAALSARVPVIMHHVHGWGIQEGMSTVMRLFYLNLERVCALFSDRLVAVSKANIQKGLDFHICKANKFTLIYNGIQLEKFSKQVDKRKVYLNLGLNPECKIVGMIGRLDKQKNPLDFIEAAAIVKKEYPMAQFIIAGDGSLRQACEALIRERNLESSFFLLGYRNDIDQILPVMTMMVLSSLWEGLPVVFQEAMSAGKPIVANNVDGASDVVIDGKTGFLVTPHNVDEMAHRILYLLQNEALCAQMGATAKQNSELFSSEKMVENMEALYRELFVAYLLKNNKAVPPEFST